MINAAADELASEVVLLLRVAERPRAGLDPLLDDLLDDDLAHFVTEELNRAHVDGDFTWRSGEITAELELLAVNCKADLVVVGHSTHPRLHLGGVPRQLLARGRCPILVVP